ncbi:MAG TPA: serine/threonine-protein kinase [Myxococcota bacterium]|nr:serine/threonine-protein kinase [Myxococcota bacterium]
MRCISTGGMARVYEARRESLAGVAPKVAIKVILPEHAGDATFQQLFVNEARIGSQLQHQNLVQIQDFDRDGHCFYLVMEYVEGTTLRRAASLCRRNGIPIPLSVIAEIGRQVCEGLHYAHTARGEDGHPLKLVHRDIKPSNLILNPQGVVKVLDFGISKALIASERRGTVKGTWGYMSPEQAAGVDVNAAADQFGMAAVLYELAMLQPLFPEKEPRVIRKAMSEDEGARRANVIRGPHGQLAPVLLRALQRDPAARFQDTMAMAAALRRLVPDPVSAREQLLHFQDTAARLAQGQAPEPRRSHSTMSRHGSQGTQGSAHTGLPVAVGDAHAPREVEIGAPPPKLTGRSPWTMGAVFMAGLSILVLGFAGVALVAHELDGPRTEAGDAVITEPADIELPEAELPEAIPSVAEPPEAIPPVAEPPEAEAPEPVEAVSEPPEPRVVRPEPAVVVRPRLQPVDEPVASGELVGEPVEEVVEEAKVEAPAAPRSAATTGLLTVSSLPRSKVIVDGQFVRFTPLYEHELPAGPHTVRLETDDGRYTRFRVDVPAGGEIRRIWHFEQGAWVEN